MVYLSGVNKNGLATVKRTNPNYCLFDEIIARKPIEQAKRFVRLYNFLFGV